MVPFEKKMKKLLILLSFSLTAALAQEPAAVSINGREFTRAEFEQMVRAVGGAIPAQFNANRQGFLEMYGLMQRLAEEAKKARIHELEPYATRLRYNEMTQLATYVLDVKNREAKIMPEDQRAYYEKHKDRYSVAKTKVLYLSFSNTPTIGAGAARSEADTKALAAKIKAQLDQGAGFVDLVRQYSDDADSKSRDGDFPDIKPTDSSLPTAITQAIVQLKPGQVSEPIRQPNGYYLFRLEAFTQQPFEEVRDDIYIALQKEFLDKWVDSVRDSVKIEVRDQNFLSGQAQP